MSGIIPQLLKNVQPPVRQLLTLADNKRRSASSVDYVLFTLPQTMPPLPEPRNLIERRILGDPPLSLAELERAFRRIAQDSRPRGVILALRGFQMSLADLQTLRDSITRLRMRGKRVICYAQDYDIGSYFVASAADELVIQPSGQLMTLGLRAGVVFLKDALAEIGVQVEPVAISPYKSALDTLSRSEISPEAREQLEWLLDSQYDTIVDGIAQGRDQTPDAVREMIDSAPHLDRAALDAGYVDAIANEENLPRRLEAETVLTWEQAQKVLYHLPPRDHNRYVALLPVSGMIVNGTSQKPPNDIPVPLVGGERAGDLTVVQQVRQLMRNDDVSAVVLYIDSPGGSATASEAMAAALDELARSVPLVVFMGSVAASGGYYIATPARWIVAQPGTITGSIGVVMGKAVTSGLYQKLRFNRMEFTRGANMEIVSDQAPYTDAQRALVRASIERIYDQFTQRVAESRGMTQAEVDAIGGGRVWTGQQAFERGLVDELGDLQAALSKARTLARLPGDAPLALPRFKGDDIGPRLVQQVNPAASLDYLHRGVRHIFSGKAQMLMPFVYDGALE